ncbi:MAG TPA: TonB-dependent receptor plug domain-containing protein, partial [Vicinamibacterales bacterium]|nr:TonB-dependent receptor plug domain-containing protein [Vicinamibacterales bacterium]
MRITTPTLLLTLVVGVTDARSQTTQPDLARATLEELLNVEITSASRKEQRADQAPAAVYVITQDDIRRSGITVLPEVFRLVPGMQVAQINSSDWAISVRGFNDLWSNKLLVLVDGRSIFTREFSGVLWNAQDLMLEDIDRIEVIRGPGGTVWGANAVNGVINIITKSANDTKGALVRLGGGSYAGADAAVRYGGSFGNTAYRVYSQWSDHGQSESAPQVQANDAWNRLTNGFRTDWAQGGQAVTLEGNL